ncbi:probably inactive receptor-like protein kinase At2g46850 [Salvia miltiorrhiza]|uniref:probably inactive receptor-like protein kinase At2g46850 n=1 Tax=Salvia miltiorrhiza TaxID=226208 RepID=UPI0025AC0FEA|nr:probably inactive receptor-like protein kinase At2g46850 [Salvia miltiorrhiza]
MSPSSILFLLHAPLLLASACGPSAIPFPFHLSPASPAPAAFRLSCLNSSSLFLTLASRSYRVLRFLPDGLLLDFPNASLCRHYNDLRSFPFAADQYLAVSADNVLDLYGCDDSSLCKPECERTSSMPSCDGRAAAAYPSCCYPLSDRGAWRPADGLAAFSRYGCRGFSSWVVVPGSAVGIRGVKLEWALPRNSTAAPACAANANVVNATSVANGFRCRCVDGFSGDGFPAGVGCIKSCFKDGKEVHGNECYEVKHGRKKAIILAGLLTSTLSIVSLTALFLMKRSIRSHKLNSEHCQTAFSSHKARLFTYHELEEATMGFGEGLDGAAATPTSTLYGGVVGGGSRVAVQKVLHCDCETEADLIRVMLRLETLAAVSASHGSVARVVGWSVNPGAAPLVVYDRPENGTLMDHLRRARHENVPFHWHRRLAVAAQTASTLAFLHNDISPPVFHHDLHSACIFLDADFSVKLAGFELRHADDDGRRRRSDVYGLGLVLLEIITGNAAAEQALHKGKLEEMVDPSLYYHEQPPSRREQIQIVVDLATRCLLFGADAAKLGMADVARELLHIARDCVDGGSRRGPALEETFSNSSLLQMISMSPDSIYVPSQTKPDSYV